MELKKKVTIARDRHYMLYKPKRALPAYAYEYHDGAKEETKKSAAETSEAKVLPGKPLHMQHEHEISHIEWIETRDVLVSADYGGIAKVWGQDGSCKTTIKLASKEESPRICGGANCGLSGGDPGLQGSSRSHVFWLIRRTPAGHRPADGQDGAVAKSGGQDHLARPQRLRSGGSCRYLQYRNLPRRPQLQSVLFPSNDIRARSVVGKMFKQTLFNMVNDIIYLSPSVCISSVHPVSPAVADASLIAWDVPTVFSSLIWIRNICT